MSYLYCSYDSSNFYCYTGCCFISGENFSCSSSSNCYYINGSSSSAAAIAIGIAVPVVCIIVYGIIICCAVRAYNKNKRERQKKQIQMQQQQMQAMQIQNSIPNTNIVLVDNRDMEMNYQNSGNIYNPNYANNMNNSMGPQFINDSNNLNVKNNNPQGLKTINNDQPYFNKQ